MPVAAGSGRRLSASAETISTLLALIVLPLSLKLTGVWLAVPTAQTVTFAIAVIVKQL